MSRTRSHKIAFLIMMVLIPLGLALPISLAYGQKRIMLVLGSANMETLSERVQVAYGLYRGEMAFDRIVVSGGCAAHGSGICEASEMKKQLIKLGVPDSVIIKEEKSKTTLQNYLYSRQITDESGQLLLNRGDKLYVVSNHWHAIAVAARFRTFDQVDAHYYISGNLIPKEKDPVDYVGIYHGYESQEHLLQKMLSNQIIAADYNRQLGLAVYYNQLGLTFVKKNKTPVKEELQFWTGAPTEWDGMIDDIYYDEAKKNFILFRKEMYHRFTIAGQYVSSHQLSDWLVDLPEAWLKRGVDALVVVDKNVYVFCQDMLWMGTLVKGRFMKKELVPIVNYFQEWPFSWGTGDIDAALFDSKKRVLKLFRAKECLEFSVDKRKVTLQPQNTRTTFNDID